MRILHVNFTPQSGDGTGTSLRDIEVRNQQGKCATLNCSDPPNQENVMTVGCIEVGIFCDVCRNKIEEETMSADNHSVCPKCKGVGAYVSNSLREYWDIGMGEDGMFHVLYNCKFSHCGWTFRFEANENAVGRKIELASK